MHEIKSLRIQSRIELKMTEEIMKGNYQHFYILLNIDYNGQV